MPPSTGPGSSWGNAPRQRARAGSAADRGADRRGARVGPCATYASSMSEGRTIRIRAALDTANGAASPPHSAASPPPGAGCAASSGEESAAAPGSAPVIDATRLRVAIARLSRRLRRHQLAGLTPTQLSALATVEKIGPLRLGDLAAAEGIAPSTLTRLVTVLEDAGYVQRHTEPGDARASRLAITPDGQAVLARIREETTRVLAGMLADLTPEQKWAIAAALPALEHLAGPDPRDPRDPRGQ